MMLLYLIVGSLGGYGAHQLRRFTARITGGWREIMHYTLGVMLNFPFAVLLYHRLPKDDRDKTFRFSVSYVMSFAAFGVGVIAGWVFDEVTG